MEHCNHTYIIVWLICRPNGQKLRKTLVFTAKEAWDKLLSAEFPHATEPRDRVKKMARDQGYRLKKGWFCH